MKAKQYADGALLRFSSTQRCACASGLPPPGLTTKYVTCDLAPKKEVSRKLMLPRSPAGARGESRPGFEAVAGPVGPGAGPELVVIGSSGEPEPPHDATARLSAITSSRQMERNAADTTAYLYRHGRRADLRADGADVFSVHLRGKAEADRVRAESDRAWTIVRPGSLTDEPGTGNAGEDPIETAIAIRLA